MISLRSLVTQKVLNYFFVNPGDGLYVNALARTLKLDKRNLVKKLRDLEAEGILKSKTRGNLKFYSINKAFPLYKEYKRIVLRSVGLEQRLSQLLGSVPDVKEAYLFGSFAENREKAHSDIDLLIVGGHDLLELYKRIDPFQNEIAREINIVNMEEEEFRTKMAGKDPFLSRIFSRKPRKLL